MNKDTRNALTGQSICHVNEWLDVLQNAALRDLIDPAGAAQIERNFAIGLLTPDGLKDAVLDALRAGPAAGLALDAIARGFAPDDVIELRALDPAGGGGLSHCERLDDPTGRAALEAFIRNHLGVRNLYVGCNPRRPEMAGTTQSASASDVPVRRNVVLDFDLKDAPPADPDWTRTVGVLRAELDPLLVLDSGNGFHVWLAIEPVSGADVAASTASIAAAMTRLGADNIADPPRIVRLPFTLNLPNAKKRERGATVRLALPC
ncbi:MAG: hypothetical protein NXH83_19520 [Rhodobacteraceae bacterium]|nr:hypothetical protein [Paracoccaceae bacterium]